jgi:hypothetical protein
MTIEATTVRNDYAAGSGVTAFPFTWRCDHASWVKVYVGGVLHSSGFSVALNPTQSSSPGGTVTFLIAPEGVTVAIVRGLPLTQSLDLKDYSAFPAESLEAALDRQVMLLQGFLGDIEAGDDLEAAARIAADAAEATNRSAGDAVEATARAAADAALIASGVAPSNVGIAMVVAKGASQARKVEDHLGDVVNVLGFAGIDPTGVADSRSAINAAIAYATANQKRAVYLPAGVYRITGPIELLPPGGSWNQITLFGDGQYFAGAVTGGTKIYADFSDNPAIAVSFARTTSIQHMTIVGKNTVPVGAMDRSVAANWVVAGLAANADSRYAPYAGIAIEPYSGAARGAGSQYNHAYDGLDASGSSWVGIIDVGISNFVVGFVAKPNGTDNNGDFTFFRDCIIDTCKYGVSIGHTQSRQVQIDHDQVVNCYVGLVNQVHGRQIGVAQFWAQGSCFDGCQSIVEVNTAYGGPTLFTSCYAEDVGSIGVIGSASGDETGGVFDSCQFNFYSDTCDRIGGNYEIPIYHISGRIASDGQSCDTTLIFRNCQFQVKTGFFVSGAAKISMEGVHISMSRVELAASGPLALLYNQTAGVIQLNYQSRYLLGVVKGPIGDPATGYVVGTQGTRDLTRPTKVGIKWAGVPTRHCGWEGQGAAHVTSPQGEVVVLPLQIDPSQFTGYSRAGKVVTYTYAARTAGSDAEVLVGKGDLLIDSGNGLAYLISNVVGTTLTLNQLNDLAWNGSVDTPRRAVGFGANYVCIYPSRLATTKDYLWGDFTSGSAVITNVGGAGGWFPGLDCPAAGDFLISNGYNNQAMLALHAGAGGAKVVSFNTNCATAAGTITLNKAANATRLRVPINFWMLKGD